MANLTVGREVKVTPDPTHGLSTPPTFRKRFAVTALNHVIAATG